VSVRVSAPFSLVVIGGSAGAFDPLLEILRGLDGEQGAGIFVVLHIPAQGGGALTNVIKRATTLPTEYAVAGERIVPGRVYVAPPDQHLSVDDEHVHVHRGPRENHCRPAIDPLFRSAARHHGPRVAAVLLSGALDDGTAGLLAVKRRGGLAIVQDPEEALHPSMPRSALANVSVDQVLGAKAIAPFLRATLAGWRARPPADPAVFDPLVEDETALQEESPTFVREIPPGHPSPFSCPECGGVLFERADVETPHFRCRTGHAYSPRTLAALQGTVYEDALWAGLRSLRERVALTRRMAERATSTGRVHSATILAERIEVLESHARSLEELLDRASHEGKNADGDE
jgi:two-component system chemotaxis response regulator CheB